MHTPRSVRLALFVSSLGLLVGFINTIRLWQPFELRSVARKWFEEMRACGPDVVELLHDGHPTACVEGAAFGYVNAFKAHVNVGFFSAQA